MCINFYTKLYALPHLPRDAPDALPPHRSRASRPWVTGGFNV